jgi:carboxypeptidase Taq
MDKLSVMSALDALKQRLFDVNALEAATALMEWDHQTYMPEGSAAARAEHVGILSRMAHETFVADETLRLAEEARAEASTEDEKALVRVVRRDLDLKTKIPASLVSEKVRVGSIAHEEWVKARASNDFNSFAPTLEKMFDIVRSEADHLGYQAHIYDALIDQYEEGATHESCKLMFEGLKGPQVALVKAITEAPGQPDDSFLYGEWDVDTQRIFTEKLAKSIGFDFNHGRQDIAAHPFCTNFSVGDVRLTTRYKDYLPSSIFATLHEAGHGMYEQGQRQDWDRTPLAGGVSLGVHESQSRTWENIVGRSRAFWNRFYPDLQQAFPQLGSVNLDSFYRAVNKVERSYIRVEADELTYNLHVLVRFEIESAVLDGTLAVKDIPDAWNAKYADYLGITPRNDAEGCLQDVHWSAGLIGYFPTYTMGNLLSYQIWNKLRADLGDTDALIEAGEFGPILGWLQEKVYRQGKKFPPTELAIRVTGAPVTADAYLEGISAKYRAIYGI